MAFRDGVQNQAMLRFLFLRCLQVRQRLIKFFLFHQALSQNDMVGQRRRLLDSIAQLVERRPMLKQGGQPARGNTRNVNHEEVHPCAHERHEQNHENPVPLAVVTLQRVD